MRWTSGKYIASGEHVGLGYSVQWISLFIYQNVIYYTRVNQVGLFCWVDFLIYISKCYSLYSGQSDWVTQLSWFLYLYNKMLYIVLRSIRLGFSVEWIALVIFIKNIKMLYSIMKFIIHTIYILITQISLNNKRVGISINILIYSGVSCITE